MKLIAATTLALAAADERAFADKNDFITAQELWWYKQWWAGNDKPAEYIANTETAIDYFTKYVDMADSRNGMRFGGSMQRNMNGLVRLAKNMNIKCERQGKPEYAKLMQAAAQRERRSSKLQSDSLNNFTQYLLRFTYWL